MDWKDEDFPNDNETLKEMVYKEFNLSATDETNLSEIEKNLKDRKVNSNNKKDLLDYLEKLYVKLSEIKKAENKYEGDANFNMNRYLQRIKKLITELEKI